MAVDPAAAGTLGTVLAALILYILRERKKSKNDSSNNGDIKAIKEISVANQKSLVKLDKGQGIIHTEVKNIQKNCMQTTSRFGKEITENRKDIKGILKDRP